MKNKNKIVIITLTVIVILTVIISFKYYQKKKLFNDDVNNAEYNLSQDKFDDAITNFQEALSYKNDDSLNVRIKSAELLKSSKEYYDKATEEMRNKKYLEAITDFSSVDTQDTKRYSDAQNKLNECKQVYVNDNLKIATEAFNNNKFDDAKVIIATILKVDSANSNVLKLKEDLEKTVNLDKAKELLNANQTVAKILGSECHYYYAPDAGNGKLEDYYVFPIEAEEVGFSVNKKTGEISEIEITQDSIKSEPYWKFTSLDDYYIASEKQKAEYNAKLEAARIENEKKQMMQQAGTLYKCDDKVSFIGNVKLTYFKHPNGNMLSAYVIELDKTITIEGTYMEKDNKFQLVADKTLGISQLLGNQHKAQIEGVLNESPPTAYYNTTFFIKVTKIQILN